MFDWLFGSGPTWQAETNEDGESGYGRDWDLGNGWSAHEFSGKHGSEPVDMTHNNSGQVFRTNSDGNVTRIK